MERVTEQQYWMDGILRQHLDTIAYNLDNDWDFVAPITGTGMVRVGKSMIAQQVAKYIAWKKKTPFTVDNVVFSGEELVDLARKLPKNSAIIYDEARESLDSKKAMMNISKNMLDFFAECGMYNHFMVLILPDFFDLNKQIALSRSEFLINVFRHSQVKSLKDGSEVLEYKRGYFEFYGRKAKRHLYLWGKKNDNDYGIGKRDFWGEFRKHWCVDEAAYLKKKTKFVTRDRAMDTADHRWFIQRNTLIRILRDEYKLTGKQISELMKGRGTSFAHQMVQKILADPKKYPGGVEKAPMSY